MNALVTGGAGFIGSHLVNGLEAEGVSVRVLDNLSTGSRAHLDKTGAELLLGDITDRSTVDDAMQGIDLVFHLAAMIPPSGFFSLLRNLLQTS